MKKLIYILLAVFVACSVECIAAPPTTEATIKATTKTSTTNNRRRANYNGSKVKRTLRNRQQAARYSKPAGCVIPVSSENQPSPSSVDYGRDSSYVRSSASIKKKVTVTITRGR